MGKIEDWISLTWPPVVSEKEAASVLRRGPLERRQEGPNQRPLGRRMRMDWQPPLIYLSLSAVNVPGEVEAQEIQYQSLGKQYS